MKCTDVPERLSRRSRASYRGASIGTHGNGMPGLGCAVNRYAQQPNGAALVAVSAVQGAAHRATRSDAKLGHCLAGLVAMLLFGRSRWSHWRQR